MYKDSLGSSQSFVRKAGCLRAVFSTVVPLNRNTPHESVSVVFEAAVEAGRLGIGILSADRSLEPGQQPWRALPEQLPWMDVGQLTHASARALLSRTELSGHVF